MKVFKSYICVALCVVLLCCTLAFGASAQETARLNITITSGTFYMSVDGGESEFMGNSYSNTFAEVGKEYTLTATSDGDYGFLYWKNSNGKILSTDEQYTFVFANDTNITAVYNKVSSSRGYVTFLTSSNQELFRQLYSASVSADRISVVDSVSKPGFIFKGWSIDGINPIEPSQLKNTIKSALSSGNVILTPIYEKDFSTQFKVNVTNGQGSASYYLLATAAVTASESVDGKPFSYWVNDSGEIVSFSRDYSFAVTRDETLTAVYGQSTDEKIINRISGAFSDSSSVTFVSQRSLSDELTLVQSGILIVNSRAVGTNEDSFIIGGSGVVKGTTSDTSSNGTYMLTKINATGTWYARPYVIYADANGDIITSYGEIATAVVE